MITLILFALPISVCAQHTDHMLEVPLKEEMVSGVDYPAIHFDSLVLKPVYFLIEPETNGYDYRIRMYFDATADNFSHAISLQYYTNADKQINIDYFPVAFLNSLVGMEVEDKNGTPQVTLTVDKTAYGVPFFLDLGQMVLLDGFSVRFDAAIEYRTVLPDGGSMRYDLTFSVKERTESVSFCDETLRQKGWVGFAFGIWWVKITEAYGDSIKLQITKMPKWVEH